MRQKRGRKEEDTSAVPHNRGMSIKVVKYSGGERRKGRKTNKYESCSRAFYLIVGQGHAIFREEYAFRLNDVFLMESCLVSVRAALVLLNTVV